MPRQSPRVRRAAAGRSPSPPYSNTPPPSPPELVVITQPEVALRARGAAIASATGADVAPLSQVLAEEGITLRPLFGLTEDRLRMRTAALAAAASAELPDLSRFYTVDAPPERLEEIADRLRATEVVEAAFVKPGAEPAQINDMLPSAQDAPPITADFTAQQGYLDAAPRGIDARFASTRTGGNGTGIRIIDIEGAWRFTHEDLGVNQGGLVGGTESTDIRWRNHGTAVIGEFGGDRNGFGVTGICPDANVRAVSIFGDGSAAAIRRAADLLTAGDVILLELHRPGPRHSFAVRDDQLGYIAIEWWPDDLAAIQYAVGRGVIVVEAAGNGAENLDDVIYDTPGPGFPASWRNPFRRAPVDSGAIVVGAGAPPSGSFGPDRCRLDFSNFGALIDAQGWGREVVTCGYGDLQGGDNEDLWYTRRFSGTSSASPIVVGAVASLQGIVRGAGRPLLTGAQVRNLLRTTGSPQQNGPNGDTGQRIGNRPDLRALVNAVLPKPKDKEKDLKDKEKDLKDKEKDFKDKEKDIKDKDFKDIKEKEREKSHLKDLKDRFKEFKERENSRIKDFKDIRDTQLNPTAAAAGGVEDRVGALEEAVSELAHFISSDLRPDVGASALAGEEEAAALSGELQKQASDAKGLKDAKDAEKHRDR